MAARGPTDAAWRRMACALVLLGAFVQARKGIVGAALWAEDGSVLLSRWYAGISPADWFASYAGYAAVLPNLLASVVCRLPTEWLATAFAVAACLVSTLPCLELLRREWHAVAPLPPRAIAAVFLAWAPLGNWAKSALLMNSQWYALLWLFLLTQRPEGRRGRAAFGLGVLTIVLAWSHPLSVVVLVVVVVQRLALTPHSLTGSKALVIGVVSYLAIGVESAGERHLGHAATASVPYLLVRVGFESVFGLPARDWLAAHRALWLVLVAGALVWVGVGWLAWRGWHTATRERRRLVLGALAFAVLAPIAALAARGALVTPMEPLGQRYVHAARFCLWLVALLGLGDRVPRRWLLAAAVAWLAVQLPLHRPLRAPPPAEGVPAFLTELAREEARLGGRSRVVGVLPRGDWPIHIVPR